MLTERELVAVARRALAEGRAFKQGWYDDGDGESGPSGGATPTVAWGRVRLTISRNGSCDLWFAGKADRWGMPRYFSVYGTHMGSGHWGGTGPKDFWVDRAREQIRDAVQQRCEKPESWVIPGWCKE
jgi:hypothetical protein